MHPIDCAKFLSDELWPCVSFGSAVVRMSAVGTASISPRPMYGGPARSPTVRRNPVTESSPVTGSGVPCRLASKATGAIGFGIQSGPTGRVCCTKPPNGCDFSPVTIFVAAPSRGSKKPMPVGLVGTSAWFGLKSPKVVKAAVRPGPLTASRLSFGFGWPSGSNVPAGCPPPVAGSSEVNWRFVGVARAARETRDTQVDPGTQVLELTIPGAEMASAELM